MKAATDANKKMEIDVLNQKAEQGKGEIIDTEYNGMVTWTNGDPNEDSFFATDEDGEYLDDIDIDGHIAFLLFAAFDTTTSALTYVRGHE